jgi:hypothetical protein
MTCTNYTIDRKSQNGPSSTYISPWGPERPKNNRHGVLHGSKWIMFHGIPYIALDFSKYFLIAKPSAMPTNQITIGFKSIILPWFGPGLPTIFCMLKVCCRPSRSPLPLSIRLEGPSIAKVNVDLHSIAFGWFSKALRFSWSRLLVHMPNGPKCREPKSMYVDILELKC